MPRADVPQSVGVEEAMMIERPSITNSEATHWSIEETSGQTFEFTKTGVYEIHQMMVIQVRWGNVPWWKRLQSVAELPIQLVRFLVTGDADIMCVRNVRSKR